MVMMKQSASVEGRLAARSGDAADREPAPPGFFARAVFRLDERIRRHQGVFEYSNHPDCIFRIEIRSLGEAISLADGTRLVPGERIIGLHTWNEHIPIFPKEGLTLAWGRTLGQRLGFSLGELARYLERQPDLADVRAIRAEMALGPPEQTKQIVRLSSRYGFEPMVRTRTSASSGRLHRIGENILIAMLVLARNPAAWTSDDLRRDRAEVFMSRSKLCRLHGRSGPRAAAS